MKQQYDSYKPSGIDWIGDIPGHWEIRKTSQLFLGIGSGTTPTSGNPKYYSAEGINWLQTGDLNDGKIIITSKKITESAIKDFSSLKIYPKGSIVIAMYGATIGKLGILDIETTTNQACCVLPNSNEINQKYAFFVYRAGKQSMINSAYGGGQPNISQDTIKSFRIPLPPLSEQQAIADYLDKKCGEIDTAIAKVDREIELIDELKQSEISRVVTRGLNPDAPLRPSGIDWIGDIPEHWEKCRFKNFIALKTSPSTSDVKIGLENIESSSGNFIETDSEFDGNGTAFNHNNILYGKLRPYLRKVWLAEFEGNAIGDFFVFTSLSNSSSSYIKYLLLSDGFTKQADSSTYGAKMPRVSSDFILTLPFYLPPLPEQQAIADYLDKKCGEIDGLKAKLIKKRETLTELRQSIISEVVTGKRKVI